jgi:hypothetical protein
MTNGGQIKSYQALRWDLYGEKDLFGKPDPILGKQNEPKQIIDSLLFNPDFNQDVKNLFFSKVFACPNDFHLYVSFQTEM